MYVWVRQAYMGDGFGVKAVYVSDVLEPSIHEHSMDQLLKRRFPFVSIPDKMSEPGWNDDPFLVNGRFSFNWPCCCHKNSPWAVIGEGDPGRRLCPQRGLR